MFFREKWWLCACLVIFIIALQLRFQAFAEEIDDEFDLSSEIFEIYLPTTNKAIVYSEFDNGELLADKIAQRASYAFFGLNEFNKVDLSRYPYLIVGSDSTFDISNSNAPDMDAIEQIRDMVEAGGIVIVSGKSSAIPALLGGSNGPKFYHFSGMPRPYGNSQRVPSFINDPILRERMGNVGEFMAYSALPQKNHSLIGSAGSAKILTTADYVFEEIAYDYWGPYWNVFAARVITGVEYDRGSNGGKVIYINTELSENEKAGG